MKSARYQHMALIDFHMHSNCSDDGEFSPTEIVSLARQAGLRIIALSDHNNAHGVQEAIDAAEATMARGELEVIPATELDCTYNGLDFHVLGYYIDHRSAKLAAVGEALHKQELEAARIRVELVNKKGINIDLEEALARSRDGTVTGELIAEIVLEKPDCADNPLLRPYLPGGSRSDNPYVNFYWDYCAQGKPAFVEIISITMQQAIDLIRELGGVPVLAHPGNILRGQPPEMLDEIIALGIAGVEAYSSYHTPEQCLYYQARADAAGILATGGSDFHGKTKPSVKLGRFGLDNNTRYPQQGLEIAAALNTLAGRKEN